MSDESDPVDTSIEIRTEGLPADMQLLLDEYPRDSWEAHPGFKELTRQWLGAHLMFRRLSSTVIKDTEAYLDGKKDVEEYIRKLSYRGGALVNNLHGHHSWEDNRYFPELFAADPRFKVGLDILEKDHDVLHRVLDNFTDAANRFIRLVDQGNVQARAKAGELHTLATSIEALLQRHLGDEEELAVPIILHHRLRG